MDRVNSRFNFELNNSSHRDVMTSLKKETLHPLTDRDINYFFQSHKNFANHVVSLSELSELTDLDDIFPLDLKKGPDYFAYRIILLESEPNSGHWVALSKYKFGDVAYNYEFFDPYGYSPDKILSMNSKETNVGLGQRPTFILKLMEGKAESPNAKVFFNTHAFQGDDIKLATCGRHVVFRLLCCEHFRMDLNRYGNFIFNLLKKPDFEHLSSDELICLLTNIPGEGF